MHKLKKWRIAVSAVFFLMFLWVFIGIVPQNEYFTHTVSALQFFPSFLEFTVTFLAGGGAGFIIILVLTFLFGRVYCSFLCPLGFVQDVIINFKFQILNFKLKHRYDKSLHVFHYAVTAAVIIMLVLGSSALLGALDPFANFGRMTVNLLKPLYVKLNNLLVVFFSYTGAHPLNPVKLHGASAHSVVFTAGFLALIAALSLWKNRLYCNTLCPAGGVLSLASRKTAYKLVFEEEKCNNCGMCEASCKANCIDAENRKVDMSRCVMCYNCLSACKRSAIEYKIVKKKAASFDSRRRESIKALTAAAAGIAAASLSSPLLADTVEGKAPQKKNPSILPPGSGSEKHFTSKCIACHLCVSACPSRVLSPSFLEYGTGALLQPRMDYDRSYCNYPCVECTRVCPTGAILPLNVEEKKISKIGTAVFIAENCIVRTSGAHCLICNEHCPTKACSAVTYENGLRIPKVIEDTCIGCGACEYVCPAAPVKAIYVEGLKIHEKAAPPRRGDGNRRGEGGGGSRKRGNRGQDFPF